MPLRRTRTATAVAVALALGLACLPACKKKAKPTDTDSPNPTPVPGPGVTPPGPGAGTGRDPNAPRSPVFGTSDPRTAAMRAEAEANMKQIMLGLHAFHDTYQAFPAGFADKTGKPGLSWRVAVLPFIEQNNLFRQFKLDEPWDSENNKALVRQMPKVFAPPRTDTYGYTFCRGFSGPNTWLPPQQQSAQPGQPLRGARFTDFTDGLSNTIVVAEAYDPVIWTKPDELAFDPQNPPRLGGVFASGTVVGLGDGSVRFLRPGMSQKTLANLIQINDGNIVNWDD